MLDFEYINSLIASPCTKAKAAAQAHWDSIAKPLNGLGRLETVVTKIAALTENSCVGIGKRAVAVFCADNGVVCEGVTQTDASVTATMAAQIRDHRSSVCLMAAAAGADVFAHDMGMLKPVEGVEGCHIADGTGNIAVGPAMTREVAEMAIKYGMDLVLRYSNEGYKILVTGEMGIGNTTTSSAVASQLLDMPVEQVTGRGAGLSDSGLERKLAVIKKAVEVNAPDKNDPLDVLSKLGGFDIAGMVGMFIGGAVYRVPIVVDGLISSVSALIAARLCPNCRSAMIASHTSKEPAAKAILDELELEPVIYADMKLGEGTGGVCMLPLLDMALSVYHGSAEFEDTGIEKYRKLGGESK
ncbi:MAG: nicotinate-nucleotide--dimethylbenzimidazole phosphoribosyltransferase [Clostridia bacterium]|nr:nicotinate-nucleotide--dimethylbenzimidazole phosphoribosyltransferase [Clostridia bacterium]